MERKQPGIEEFVGIYGSDNHIPLYKPDALKQYYDWDDVYWGINFPGKGKVVPNVGDVIEKFATMDSYLVTEVPKTDFVVKYRPRTPNNTNTIDSILSFTEQSFVIHYNKHLNPFTLTISPDLRTHIREAVAYRIYRGTEIDESKIVSVQYNNSGEIVGTDIPLELSAVDAYQNNSIKGFPSCNTNAELMNGEAMRVAVLSATGEIIGKYYAIIDTSTFHKPAFVKSKLITNIFLETSLIDPSVPNVIRFPANLTSESFMPIGVVQYSDGSQTRYVVDGTKFELQGIGLMSNRAGRGPLTQSLATTIIGSKTELALVYYKSPDEGVLMKGCVDENKVGVKYDLIISESKRSWGVKIYTYPVWLGELEGYTLRHYLLNLDRDELYDVTPYVSLAVNSDPFYPKAWAHTQRLTFMIELMNSGGAFGLPGDLPNPNSFIHSQTMDIILRAPATEDHNRNIWEVSSDSSSKQPVYGTELRARIVGDTNSAIDIGNSIETLDEFLKQTYYRTDPLVNPETEDVPMKPTELLITYNGVSRAVPVDKFKEAIDFGKRITMYENVSIAFVRRMRYTDTDKDRFLYLSIVEMTIRP